MNAHFDGRTPHAEGDVRAAAASGDEGLLPPSTLVERLRAQRCHLAMLLGEEFEWVLTHARAEIVAGIRSMATDNPFSAAIELARDYDAAEQMKPALLLVAALDLCERPA